ncbi:VQ motif-containing protein 31-like [Zingiber officinale]|uniref:VQ domain-containing protein n=1 Tax=Zingiber officinale TaxID=94328 RepID=A0A8J5LS48_ZINOF|nr:VQ motif-containing protein 31-like [Zingiber officinale]KAG6532304.1 hypothetical protein ZIOFF_006144 [Zingiber officinale]
MDKPPASASTTTTTFIQADVTTFKELVQRLTGPAESTTTASTVCSPPSSASSSSSSLPAGRLKRLHHGSHLRLAIPRTDAPSGSTKLASPAAPSPAATFARLDISAEEKSGEAIEEEEEEEERAIKERRFYLYPSPRAKNRVAEPELLPLFPITSPRAAAGEP